MRGKTEGSPRYTIKVSEPIQYIITKRLNLVKSLNKNITLMNFRRIDILYILDDYFIITAKQNNCNTSRENYVMAKAYNPYMFVVHFFT